MVENLWVFIGWRRKTKLRVFSAGFVLVPPHTVKIFPILCVCGGGSSCNKVWEMRGQLP